MDIPDAESAQGFVSHVTGKISVRKGKARRCIEVWERLYQWMSETFALDAFSNLSLNFCKIVSNRNTASQAVRKLRSTWVCWVFSRISEWI